MIGPSGLQATRLILHIISSRVLNLQTVSPADGVPINFWVLCLTAVPIAKLNLAFHGSTPEHCTGKSLPDLFCLPGRGDFGSQLFSLCRVFLEYFKMISEAYSRPHICLTRQLEETFQVCTFS